MDLDNLFISDLLDTIVGETLDDRATTQALGEEGDQPEPGPPDMTECGEPEPPQDTVIEPDPVVTSDAIGEEGDQPEPEWDTVIEPDPVVTSQAIGEEGDQPEPEWSDGPADQGIWAGEDGNGGGSVVDEDETVDYEPVDYEEEPAETIDPALQ